MEWYGTAQIARRSEPRRSTNAILAPQPSRLFSAPGSASERSDGYSPAVGGSLPADPGVPALWARTPALPGEGSQRVSLRVTAWSPDARLSDSPPRRIELVDGAGGGAVVGADAEVGEVELVIRAPADHRRVEEVLKQCRGRGAGAGAQQPAAGHDRRVLVGGDAGELGDVEGAILGHGEAHAQREAAGHLRDLSRR